MDIVIRKGGMQDTEKVIQFLREIRAGMPNQEWFCLDEPEDVRKMMADGTMQLWVAEDADRLVAIFDIHIPGLSGFNYGYDLGFEESQLMRVVNLDTAAVHPDYRGLGLQRRMMQIVERSLAGEGEKILLCTIHPENRFSLENALKMGYAIQKKIPKYDSVRYVLRKDIC